MHPELVTALLTISSYLAGAIPFGLLIGLARGVDIRKQGSGNIGATNAGRVLGKKWGYAALVLDVLKGLIPTALAGYVLVGDAYTSGRLLRWLLVGLAAVLGHNFPVFLGFRGGKGVATTIGVGLAVFPFYTVGIAAALAVYALVRFGTGFVSAGSIALALTFPIAVYAFLRIDGRVPIADAWPLLAGAVLMGGLILFRHRENIERLRGGREHSA